MAAAHVFTRACWDKTGFTPGTTLRNLFASPIQLQAVGMSFLIAACVTGTCTLIAMPLAWLFARRTFPGKALWSGLMLLPMICRPLSARSA